MSEHLTTSAGAGNNQILAMSAMPLSGSVQMKIVGNVQAEGVLFNYATYERNKPSSYANNVYVWKTTSPDVPWGTTPAGQVSISSDNPVSTQFLPFSFEVGQDYIVGYSVAADPNATCSTVYIPQGSWDKPTSFECDEIDLKVVYFGNNIVQVKFNGLGKYSPSQNGNWIGIWQSDHVPYSGAPLAKASIDSGNSNGMAVIQNVQLQIRSQYSVGYFMIDEKNGGRTSLAAQATFTTSEPQGN